MSQQTPPVRIGQYRLSKTLGIGSFGKVKLAVHEKTGYKVAVKILNRNKVKKLEMAEKVRREIANLKRFTHPHIIRLYEVIHTPTDIFVIMEYVSGGELFDYIVQKGRLPENEARRFFQQIVAGVEYCHYHQVVHRDLKPENLLLDEEHNVKIADFGLSNCMEDGLFLRTSCGSPNYAAPEVISGNLYAGPEVDVWSCGVILYALLCGSLPFDDESIANLFKKIKGGIYTIPTHLGADSRDLISRMLVVDPLRRISIPEIRNHTWFKTKLPLYLTISTEVAEAEVEASIAAKAHRRRLGLALTPRNSLLSTSSTSIGTLGDTSMAVREGLGISDEIDPETVDQILRLGFPGVATAADVERCIRRSGRRGAGWNDVGVAYQLLAERKRSRQRAAQIEEANRQTAPAPAPPVPVFAASASALDVPGFSAQQQEAAAAASAAAANARRRRWYLGIQSKKDPAHVMGEVFRALRDAGFEWKIMGPYRIRARFAPANLGHLDGGEDEDMGRTEGQPAPPSETATTNKLETRPVSTGLGDAGSARFGDVKIGLQLYKVQRGIYLLDLQKCAGDAFSFMNLCARIITELKVPAAAAAAAQAVVQAAAARMELVTIQPSTITAPAGYPPAAAGTPTPYGAVPPVTPAAGGVPPAPTQTLQVMAVPGLPGTQPALYFVNPATGLPEPLPPELYVQAIMQLQAQQQQQQAAAATYASTGSPQPVRSG